MKRLMDRFNTMTNNASPGQQNDEEDEETDNTVEDQSNHDDN